MSHAHALARLPESHNYTSARRVNSVPAAAAGGRDSSTPSLSGPAIAASCFICIGACVCVCACGPHRLRHPGQRPQFVLGCHMPGSDGSAVDPAVAAHPALCEAGGTAGARDDRGRRRVRLKSAAG